MEHKNSEVVRMSNEYKKIICPFCEKPLKNIDADTTDIANKIGGGFLKVHCKSCGKWFTPKGAEDNGEDK